MLPYWAGFLGGWEILRLESSAAIESDRMLPLLAFFDAAGAATAGAVMETEEVGGKETKRAVPSRRSGALACCWRRRSLDAAFFNPPQNTYLFRFPFLGLSKIRER